MRGKRETKVRQEEELEECLTEINERERERYE